MRKKYGKLYADWRDEHGKLKMKAFPTKTGALRYQNKMRTQVAGKKARASPTSRTSPPRGPRRSPRAGRHAAAASPKKSPRSRAASNPTS